MKYFVNFFKDQTHILWLYVVAMLIPSAALAITEPYRWSTVVASLLLPGGFYALWCSVLRKPGMMILISLPLMILGAFQIVLLYLFGNSIIAVDMFVNLLTTNPSEACELLGNIYPSVILVCIIYIPLLILGVISLRNPQQIPGVKRRQIAVVGASMLAVGFGFCALSNRLNPHFEIRRHIFPINVMHNMSLAAQKWSADEHFFQTSEGFRFESRVEPQDSALRKVVVLVVGEASRADNWSLFGYSRPTTPELQKISHLVPFSDVLAQANATHKAVPIILSSVSAENYGEVYRQKSIITLFGEAGYRTVYITNQAFNRSLIEFFSREADSVIDVSNGGVGEHLDAQMIEPFEQALAQNSDRNLFVVLHTYGSHFNYAQRYPKEYARFMPDYAPNVKLRYRTEVVNSYDNSILYTDRVLSQIIEKLSATQRPATLVYCSDHGEDLMDDRRGKFLHSSPCPTYHQLHVAAFAWFSESFIERYRTVYDAARNHSDSPATTGNIFHTVAAAAGIHSPYVKQQQALTSSDYRCGIRYYLTDTGEAVPFYNSGLQREDFVALDQAGIRYNKSDVKTIKY